jgi:hypothetical protein
MVNWGQGRAPQFWKLADEPYPNLTKTWAISLADDDAITMANPECLMRNDNFRQTRNGSNTFTTRIHVGLLLYISASIFEAV